MYHRKLWHRSIIIKIRFDIKTSISIVFNNVQQIASRIFRFLFFPLKNYLYVHESKNKLISEKSIFMHLNRFSIYIKSLIENPQSLCFKRQDNKLIVFFKNRDTEKFMQSCCGLSLEIQK